MDTKRIPDEKGLVGRTPPLDPAIWNPPGTTEAFRSYSCNQCGKRMKRWDYVDPSGQIEGFIQHRKHCTGRPRQAAAVAGSKPRKNVVEEELIDRIGEGAEEEVEPVEDEGAELQMLLDAVTEVFAPEE